MKTPMQRLIEAHNYSSNFAVQVRHALNDPYSSMARQEARTGSRASAAQDYAVMYERERSKAQDRLETEYRADIGAWDWKAAAIECANNAEYDDESQSNIGRCYIGSILGTYPSGKIYAPWTSNQTDYDVMRDEVYQEVLEQLASDAGGWIECESDDIFFCMAFESDNESEEC